MFSHWEIVSGSGFFENPYDSDAVFIMQGNTEIEAIFEHLYTLTVNGKVQGKYKAGESISLAATPAPTGKRFDGWTTTSAGTFDDAGSPSAVFTMPAGDAAVTAAYTDILYTLTVIGGMGGGAYTCGTRLPRPPALPPRAKNLWGGTPRTLR